MSLQLEYAQPPVSGLAKRERQGVGPWLSLATSALIWIIPFSLTCVVLAVFVSPYLAPFFLPLIVYLTYQAVMKARQRNGDLIVSYLDLAVRLNLPMVSFLAAAVRSETGRRANQLARVHAYLATGSSLADALAEAPDVPDDVVARIQSAESLGQVRSALNTTIEDNRRLADEDGNADMPFTTLYRVYIACLFFYIPTLTFAMMIFIIPKFKEIFKDFKTTLPPLTQKVVQVSSFFSEDVGIVTWIVIFAVAALLLIVTAYWASRIFVPFLPLPRFRRTLDWFAWRLPLLHALQHDRAMAEICALFAAATRAGVSLPVAAERAMDLPVNNAFRDQLHIFHQHLVAGDTPAAAAGAARLPQLMAGLLAPTSTRSPEPELFTFLERYYRNRFSRLQMTIRGAFGPAMVLAVAAVEGTIVVAMFQPLIALMDQVAKYGPGGSL